MSKLILFRIKPTRSIQMKKIMWLLSLIILLGLSNCGSGSSSDEGKALQQKTLALVGIPQEIVANICIDDNKNGFCESVEVQAKVKLSKGDGLNEILAKLTRTQEGRYLLETYDASKDILLELKSDNVNNLLNSNGKFTLNYSGFTKTQTNKELSLLESMIDAGFLKATDVEAIRKTKNVDTFYKVLLKDFETNLNTLGDKELSTTRAVKANIKEIADELLNAGIKDTLAQTINECNGTTACIDTALTPVLIDEQESIEIVKNEIFEQKKLLSSNTFYIVGQSEGKPQLEEVSFNRDVDGFKWRVLEGADKGESLTFDVRLEGNKFISEPFKGTFLTKTDEYLLYNQDGEESGHEKLYLSLEKAKALYIKQSNQERSDFEKYILGKTLYIIGNEKKSIDITLTFKTENEAIDKKGKTFKYYITSDDKLVIDSLERAWRLKKTNIDYVIVGSYYGGEYSHDSRAYFNESKAQTYINGLQSKLGFTKEMLKDRVVYQHIYTDEEGIKGYAKVSFITETLLIRHEIQTSSKGEVLADNEFELAYTIENGIVKADAGNDTNFWILDNFDNENSLVNVTEERDIGKDGTINKSFKSVLYLYKPDDYPTKL